MRTCGSGISHSWSPIQIYSFISRAETRQEDRPAPMGRETRTIAPHISNLELVEEEPTGRKAIHAALDAYLDATEIVEMVSTDAEKARMDFEAKDHALYVSVQSRDKAAESLKKLLNL